jgi:hypothetical protein
MHLSHGLTGLFLVLVHHFPARTRGHPHDPGIPCLRLGSINCLDLTVHSLAQNHIALGTLTPWQVPWLTALGLACCLARLAAEQRWAAVLGRFCCILARAPYHT